MPSTEAADCILCGAPTSRRWRDQQDRGSYRYRCATCGGRYVITADALDQLRRGMPDTAELLATARSQIQAGTLPRVVTKGGRQWVEPAGRQ
uniref:Uncharacterized protein n=1 Tax=Cupriavidus pinatubonensis (strain JMP 134 / LMG 1197) TaxID=264198 RepID=Q46NB9_CUPPJ